MVSDYLVLREIFLLSKGALIWALVSCAQAQLIGFGVGAVLGVPGGCARVHPPDVAPEPVSELETRSRAFKLHCSHCSMGLFCSGSHGHHGRRWQCGQCG
jgi:ribosomal protein S27AE